MCLPLSVDSHMRILLTLASLNTCARILNLDTHRFLTLLTWYAKHYGSCIPIYMFKYITTFLFTCSATFRILGSGFHYFIFTTIDYFTDFDVSFFPPFFHLSIWNFHQNTSYQIVNGREYPCQQLWNRPPIDIILTGGGGVGWGVLHTSSCSILTHHLSVWTFHFSFLRQYFHTHA